MDLDSFDKRNDVVDMPNVLKHIDQEKLLTMLYDSIQYDREREKQSCFNYMQELVDKIYGVESEIIDRAKKRFKIVDPKMG